MMIKKLFFLLLLPVFASGSFVVKELTCINPDATQAGYKHMVIAPKPGGGLTAASATYKTMYGEVRSAWNIANRVMKLDVTVPCNTTATISLPDGKEESVGLGDHHYEYAMPLK